MNLKISDGEIIFKILEAELNCLIEEKSVCLKSALGRVAFMAEILVVDGRPSELKFNADHAKVNLALQVSTEDLRALREMGKDRDGISMMCGDTKVYLQVDLKSDSRPRKAA